ncbi:MAG: hypothetical protein MJ103_03970 [Saccharofermentans sp.]|nr:hypothetical protein [Saccharofermentans sp.]
MGNGYLIKCERCGYEFSCFTGTGMMFPVVYQDIVSEIKNGKYGEKHKVFLTENPSAVINCERKFYMCPDCGAIDTARDLSLYLPKEDRPAPEYIMPHELEAGYKRCLEYGHKCPSCSSIMEALSLPDEVEASNVKCPSCGKPFETEEIIEVDWD